MPDSTPLASALSKLSRDHKDLAFITSLVFALQRAEGSLHAEDLVMRERIGTGQLDDACDTPSHPRIRPHTRALC